MAIRMVRYPTNYRQALRRLHGACQPFVLLHDDLTLRYVENGIAVDYYGLRLVLFHANVPDVTYRAAGLDGLLVPKALAHIQRFLPTGYSIGQKDAVMIIRQPGGHTSTGNEQTIHYADTFLW